MVKKFLADRPAKILLGNHDPIASLTMAKSKTTKIQIPGEHEEQFIPWQENLEEILIPQGKNHLYPLSGIRSDH